MSISGLFTGLIARWGSNGFCQNLESRIKTSDQVRTRQFKRYIWQLFTEILDKLEGRLENYLLKDTRNNTVSVVKEDTPEASWRFWITR